MTACQGVPFGTNLLHHFLDSVGSFSFLCITVYYHFFSDYFCKQDHLLPYNLSPGLFIEISSNINLSIRSLLLSLLFLMIVEYSYFIILTFLELYKSYFSLNLIE